MSCITNRLPPLTAQQRQNLGRATEGAITLALFVIGCIAASGAMTSVGAGATVFTLGTAGLVTNILKNRGVRNENRNVRKTLKIAAVVGSVIGLVSILAMAGVVTSSALGWTLIGPLVGFAVLGVVVLIGAGAVLGLTCREIRQEGPFDAAARLYNEHIDPFLQRLGGEGA